MSNSQQTWPKMMILDFLRYWADHNWATKIVGDPQCAPICDVCTFDLVQWTDKENECFSILWYDDRSHERGSQYLYELYAHYVSREDPESCTMDVYKKRMKSAVKKQIDNGKLHHFKDVIQGDQRTVRKKFYQFHQMFADHRLTQGHVNGIDEFITFRDSEMPFGNASHRQVSDSSVYRTPETMNNGGSVSNSTPNWEQLPSTSSNSSFPELSRQDLIEGGILEEELARGQREEPSTETSGSGDESIDLDYIGMVDDINQLILSQPRTTSETFQNFEAREEAACVLDANEVADLSRYFSGWSIPDIVNVKNMKIIVSLKDGDSSLFNQQIISVEDSPNGFRLLSKDSKLNVQHEIGKFGPTEFPAKTLPSPDDFTSKDVKKCLKTFEESGIVFLWKQYPPPSNVRSIRHLDNLCWRLYCYKICKGFPTNYPPDDQNDGGPSPSSTQSSETLQRSIRLDMCLKTPLRERQLELEDREFEEVFDILKVSASAARRGNHVRENNGSPETEQKKLNIHLGLKSKTKYNDASLPVKLEFKNTFVAEVFDRCSGQEVRVDNSDTHTQVSSSTRSTHDSTRGWAAS